MAFDFTKFFDIRKVPLWLWAAAAVTSGFVIFGRNKWIEALGMAQARGEYRLWFGVAFLVGSTSLLLHGAKAAYNEVTELRKRRRRTRRRLDALEKLTPDEKAVLARYVREDSKTQYLNYTSGVTRSLEHAAIIYRASELSREGYLFAYNIQPWAWAQLKARPDLLAGAGQRRVDVDDHW